MTIKDTLGASAAMVDPAYECQPTPPVVDRTIPKDWYGRLAYGMSMIVSPPVLTVTVMILTALALSSPRAWTWAGVYVFLVVLVPLLYLMWLLHRGLVADLDVQLREQRIRPLLLTVSCAALAWFLMELGAAPEQLAVVAGVLSLQSMIIFLVTLRWKISVHTAAMTMATMVIWFLFDTLLPLVVGVPLIAWARVRLRRHTVAQTIAGALLGLTVSLLVL